MTEPTPIASVIRKEVERVEAGGVPQKSRRTEMPPPPLPLPEVPKRFQSARFSTYQAETDEERAALKMTARWVAAALRGDGPMLALIGVQGTGKSHLLYAAAWALYEGGRTCRPHPWYRLADELRYGRGPYEAHEVRTHLYSQKVLLLDEVRPTANTAFDDTELAKLACHSYDQEIPVILTTNVSPLEAVLGPPAASRFTQLTVSGRDRRQSKAEP
jgi:DNA replication protein DnaC